MFGLSRSSLFILNSSILVFISFWWSNILTLVQFFRHCHTGAKSTWTINSYSKIHASIVLIKSLWPFALLHHIDLFHFSIHPSLCNNFPSAQLAYRPLQCGCWFFGLFFSKMVLLHFLSWIPLSGILTYLSPSLMPVTISSESQQESFCKLYRLWVWFNSICTLPSCNLAWPIAAVDSMITNNI